MLDPSTKGASLGFPAIFPIHQSTGTHKAIPQVANAASLSGTAQPAMTMPATGTQVILFAFKGRSTANDKTSIINSL